MALKMILVLFVGTLSFASCFNKIARSSEAIDSSFLENVLDVEECARQIDAIQNNPFNLLQFIDAGLKIPRGIFTGNLVDLGNYHQCLAMEHQIEGMHIEGKYCSVLIPFEQDFEILLPQDTGGVQFNPNLLRLDNETISKIEKYDLGRREILALSGKFDGFQHDRSFHPDMPMDMLVFRLGVCVPKPCSAKQAMDSMLFNLTDLGLLYHEDYCRLPGDKTWALADYIAVGIFAALGVLTLISTCYDLCYRFLLQKDVKQMSTLCRSFSVYTNGIRLTTFSSGGGNLQCLDGIRTLAMLWVIIGHSYSTEAFLANPFDSQEWMFSPNALFITAATMTVDTFFTITGVLLVYTTAEKMNTKMFLKNIHWFYLNRYLRLTPLIAVTVLLQASYFNRITDGPYWTSVVDATETCRANWWSTLLHIQNLVNVDAMCLSHSWYVAIDFQLFVLSPLVLLWVLSGKKLFAWIGVIGGLTAVLVGSTIYSFHINMPAGNLVPSRFPEMGDYLRLYYFNTLSRASPFFVGLVFGYILHLHRNKRLILPWPIAILFWANAAGVWGGIFYFKYIIKQTDWDNHLMDNLMNSFMRPAYACAICWLITACVHGYAGPINWLLSHEAWRLPARLTYGMYLFHYPLMYSINGAIVSPTFFSVEGFAFKFLSHLVLAVVTSFFLTLLVDSPVTVLFKQLVDSAKKKKPITKTDEEASEYLEENNDIPEGIQRNTEAIDDNNIDSFNSDDVSSDSVRDFRVDSEPNDIASQSSSSEVKYHFSDNIMEPNTSRNNSNDIIIEPDSARNNSNDIIVEPSTALNNASDIIVEPNTARNNSSDIIVEPNTARNNSSDIIVEPNTARNNSSDIIVEPNTAHNNSSDIIVRPSTAQIDSSSNDDTVVNILDSKTEVPSESVLETETKSSVQ